jgi:lysine biosynthesis protein LysW
MATVTECLNCRNEIYLEAEVGVGQHIRCRKCGTELEIINLTPLELDWVYLEPMPIELKEDWEWSGQVDPI